MALMPNKPQINNSIHPVILTRAAAQTCWLLDQNQKAKHWNVLISHHSNGSEYLMPLFRGISKKKNPNKTPSLHGFQWRDKKCPTNTPPEVRHCHASATIANASLDFLWSQFDAIIATVMNYIGKVILSFLTDLLLSLCLLWNVWYAYVNWVKENPWINAVKPHHGNYIPIFHDNPLVYSCRLLWSIINLTFITINQN